ncbi:MAG: WYL domain-containing protein [Bifidobacteriaceae bacterium]|jgi:predicted DNA-binding transcriptional regulator YafY|nr:WYL domain-containing protein [Bifidobacteriaceae bacterium]
MGDAISPAERRTNLVVTLLNSRRGLTREQLRASVMGYSTESDTVAFERQFERDKEELRHLGVPIDSVVDPMWDDTVYYRIDPDAYTMPPLDFTRAEQVALAVATHLLREAGWAAGADHAMLKLLATGGRGNPDAPGAPRLRVPPADAALDVLVNAIVDRQTVAFTYRAATDGRTATRRVQPWTVEGRGRAWYLAGWDVDRAAPRLFRLSRVLGAVRTQGHTAAFAAPDPARIAEVLATGSRLERPVRATVAVERGRAHHLRRRAIATEPADGGTDRISRAGPNGGGGPGAHRGQDIVVLEIVDIDALARDIAGAGTGAVAIDPPHLREAVVARLTAAAGAPREPEGAVDDDATAAAGETSMPSGPPSHAEPPASPALPAQLTPSSARRRHARRESASERLPRILALAAYLHGAGPVTVADLAEHFDVSPGQILADVNTLWMTGWRADGGEELIDFAGDVDGDFLAGTVVLTEDQGLGRPLRLSPSEVTGLIAALRALIDGQDADAAAPARSAVDKLIAALGTPAAPSALRLRVADEPAPEATGILRDAIVGGRAVMLEYVDAADVASTRRVDPLRLFTDGVHWFVATWDRDRDAPRTFRLDRITSARMLEEPIQPRPTHARPTGLPGTGIPVTLRFTSAGRWLAEDLAVGSPLEDLDDGATQRVIPVASEAWLRSLVLGHAPLVEVVAPADVRAAIADEAAAALLAYRGQ